MERTVKFADLEAAVAEAYDKFKSENDGKIDERFSAKEDADKFGIVVILPDGTTIEKGDTDVKFALGDLAQVPTAALLLQNNTPEALLKKSGACNCKGENHEQRKLLKEIPLSARLLRAVSAIEPTGDRDGKMDIIVNNLVNLASGDPELNDALYKQLLDEAQKSNTENVLAKAEYFLYDDAQIAIDITAKLNALSVDARQLATIGATVLSDGFNPVTKQNVFDGKISERIVAAMASFGPARHSHGWLISSGVPAMASVSGAMLGIVPGTFAIAAYSPRLNGKGFSLKAAHAIRYIATKLQINAFASARVNVEK